MEVKVRIEGKFYWESLWQEYVFEGLVFLPADSNGCLPSVLLNRNVYFFSTSLDRHWGSKSDSGKERFKFVRIRSKTLDELRIKVDSLIQEEIEKLKKVKEENLKEIAKQKEIVMEFTV